MSKIRAGQEAVALEHGLAGLQQGERGYVVPWAIAALHPSAALPFDPNSTSKA
jgi:hypothetical protein